MTDDQRGSWAGPTSTLSVTEVPEGAPNLVEGKRLVGPIQGFGKMWQKTYRARLDGSPAPEHVVSEWRANFPSFWPAGNHFYPPLTGLEPGEVALIKAAGPGGMTFKTGVMVLYADDVSFTLMTPEGHMFAGWITFSSDVIDGATVAQAQVLMRAQDPIGEVGLTLGGHRLEDRFWEETLRNLSQHLGTADPAISTTVTCVDRRRQWSKVGNVRNSVAIRSTLHMLRPGRRTRTGR